MDIFFVMGGASDYPSPVSDAIGFFDSIDGCTSAISDAEHKKKYPMDANEYYIIFKNGLKTPYAFWGYHCYSESIEKCPGVKVITVDSYREGGKLEVLDNE